MTTLPAHFASSVAGPFAAQGGGFEGSALDGSIGPLITPDLLAPAAGKPSLRKRVGARWGAMVETRIRGPWGDPSRRPGMVRKLYILGAITLLAASAGGYFVFRDKPQPDYLDAGMDQILDYTLLTDEFNKLPVKERLALVGQLIGRLKSMDSGDSALMAAFAAGIAGQARDQLMTNVSHLAIDVWDTYASRYDGVTPEEQSQFLDDAFLEFTKTMESVGGLQRSISDAERLDQAKRDAKRDTERVKEGKGPSGEQLGRMFTFMRDGVGSHASPQQRARGAVLMRDMMRHFREDGSGGR